MLTLNAEKVEVVPEVKLLGTIIGNDLTWGSNSATLVKRANARMIFIAKVFRIWSSQKSFEDHQYFIHKDCPGTKCCCLAF